jgi:hypothetical protein
MRSERVDETLLRRYLLGSLAEEEQVRLEDRAFADPEYLQALEAAEADLIDAYVSGELAQSDRREFERRFLLSASRRSKVEFARAFARVAAEVKDAESAVLKSPSGWHGVFGLFRGWGPAVQFAAGTALICVAGISWLLVQNGAMRSRIASLEAQRSDLEVREEGLRRALTAESQKPPAPVSEPVVASVVFLPGLTRSETRPEQLVLDSRSQIARIEVQLEARDDYPRFRAELRTRRGEEVLTRSNLLRSPSGAGYSVLLDVPATALAAGAYELALKGMADNEPAAAIGYYYFSVRKP